MRRHWWNVVMSSPKYDSLVLQLFAWIDVWIMEIIIENGMVIISWLNNKLSATNYAVVKLNAILLNYNFKQVRVWRI